MRSKTIPAVLAAAATLPATINAQSNSTGSPGQASCLNFTLPSSITSYVKLAELTYHPAGSLVNFTSFGGAVMSSNLTSFCRAAVLITTNETSGNYANTEVWMPDVWNERLIGFGNGGWSGGVVYSSLSYDGVQLGFSSFSTNTGHNSSSLDGTWGTDKNAVVDFGYRAVHLSTVVAKNITEAYYGRAANHTYWNGCSTGGRQGLKSVQAYPEDFDGVVVGSPANWMARLQPWSIHVNLLVTPVNGSTWIPAATWSAIHEEVLKQCDMLDGVADGILEDPTICNFRPEAMACPPNAANTTSCLTLDQIKALKLVYSPYWETNNFFVFDGYSPGGENAYARGLAGPQVFGISTNYYQYMVWNDTNWDYHNLSLADVLKGDEVNPGQMDATSPDLTAFWNRGGKVIQYVGMADQLISSLNSVYYFNSVDGWTRANTQMNTTDHYRLFRVPGMNHCSGGVSYNAFGGEGQASSGMPSVSYDPQNNIVAALQAWVEEGRVPENITATQYVNNNASQGIVGSHPLCVYPAKAVYQGGNTTDSSSYICQ